MITENTTPRWKDDKQEYLKNYYQNNKQKYNKVYTYYCEVCQCELKSRSMSYHKATKSHEYNKLKKEHTEMKLYIKNLSKVMDLKLKIPFEIE